MKPGDSLLLTVGELARRSALTVRTLHHYDDIGLLPPSGRSAAGYRLYDRRDLRRLQDIQALRQLGLALRDIGPLLDDQGGDPRRLLTQQIQALDQQIRQARGLRTQLALLRDEVLPAAPAGTGRWLDSWGLMATSGKYFCASELRLIFRNWKRIATDWQALLGRIQGAMAQRLPAEAPEVQALAGRWMGLMQQLTAGDMALLARWGHMFRAEPSTHGQHPAPAGELIAFMESAVALRLQLLARHLSDTELRALDHVPHGDWQALEAEAQRLIALGLPPCAPQARACGRRWSALLDRLTRHDAALRRKLLVATAKEPLLQAGAPLSGPARAYLMDSLALAESGADASA